MFPLNQYQTIVSLYFPLLSFLTSKLLFEASKPSLNHTRWPPNPASNASKSCFYTSKPCFRASKPCFSALKPSFYASKSFSYASKLCFYASKSFFYASKLCFYATQPSFRPRLREAPKPELECMLLELQANGMVRCVVNSIIN